MEFPYEENGLAREYRKVAQAHQKVNTFLHNLTVTIVQSALQRVHQQINRIISFIIPLWLARDADSDRD